MRGEAGAAFAFVPSGWLGQGRGSSNPMMCLRATLQGTVEIPERKDLDRDDIWHIATCHTNGKRAFLG